MAGSKKRIRQKEIPQTRNVVQREHPKEKSAVQKENPDEFYSRNPSWIFHTCDTEKWAFSSKMGNLFWDEVLPFLKQTELQTWQQILLSSNNKNHFIQVPTLNKCARDRLEEKFIEQDSLISLRITGKHRIYGYHGENGSFCILWFDADHGDNESCVCRSILKHT